ncbi:unnamed protein product [Rhizophagus irregularis]|nr:unnamed protein product [Rhizophagus irregularis]CAB5368356.1 unnamed protein product [Rhizophagus irregularis]
MKKCWDLEPKNRPTITELEHKISEWIKCINEYYRKINDKDGFHKYKIFDIDNELENEIHEFVKANTLIQDNTLVQNDTLIQTQNNNSTIQSHSQVYYTSRSISKISNNTESLNEFMI